MSKKIVEISAEEFSELINKLKECLKANEFLNKQVEEYKKLFVKRDKND